MSVAPTIDRSAVEQIVETAQTRAIAQALAWTYGNSIDGNKNIVDVLNGIIAVINDDGLDRIQSFLTGDLAQFRIFELAAFINRIRSLRMK